MQEYTLIFSSSPFSRLPPDSEGRVWCILAGVSKVVPGQWVNAHLWQGAWQVTRVLPIATEMRFSLSESRPKSKRVIVFLRRLVNAKWQKSFATQCCEQSLVTPLSVGDQ